MKQPENPDLLGGIIAHPEDDDRRLVYADWLEDNDHPERAEFIRVQVRFAAASPADADYPDLLEHREEAIAALWTRQPADPVLPPGIGFHGNWHDDRDEGIAGYQRGFPFFANEPDIADETSGIDHPGIFRDAMLQMIETTTLRGLHFYCWFSRALPRILDTPAAAHLSALSVDLYNADLAPPGGTIAGILASPIAGNLQWLALRRTATRAKDTDALIGSNDLRLTRLDLWLLCRESTLRRLDSCECFGRLQRFEGGILDADGSTPADISLLANLPNLHTLRTTGYSGTLARIAQAEGFGSLASLTLHGALRGQVASFSGASLPKLASLGLAGCNLRNDDLIALCNSETGANLRILRLESNEIGDKGIVALMKSPCARALRILNLGHNNFGKQGLLALAMPDAFPRLTTLDLGSPRKCKASADDVAIFLRILNQPLRRLNLSSWPVGDAGAEAIAGNPAFANLTILKLGNCNIGPKGAAALFSSPHLRRLIELDLWDNPVDDAIPALLDPAILPELCVCRLPSDVPENFKKRLEAARKTIFF